MIEQLSDLFISGIRLFTNTCLAKSYINALVSLIFLSFYSDEVNKFNITGSCMLYYIYSIYDTTSAF